MEQREPLPIQELSVGLRDQAAVALERVDDAVLAIEALIEAMQGKPPLDSDIPRLRQAKNELLAGQKTLTAQYRKLSEIAQDARAHFAGRSERKAFLREHYSDHPR